MMTPIQFAEAFVRLPGSAMSERFDPSVTPWTVGPIERAAETSTRVLTFVKPVQSGGSVAGEVTLCRWIARGCLGDIQYNWENDEKAGDRWTKRIERILHACEPVMSRAPTDRFKWMKSLVAFPHCNLTVQGVWSEDNLSSDSIRFQINEEVHDWEPGRLEMAYDRVTTFWNSVVFNISNASKHGDQLHQAFQNGSQQHWEVRCPGCGKMHRMRTRWEDREPYLGGLRYTSVGSKREDGSYDYVKLAGTIRYQMPCGYIVHDLPTERRPLSLSGRYGEPENTGSQPGHVSMTLDAVSVDYIPWITLIQEKHQALRALRYGDPEPFRRYKTRRECMFWDPEDRPIVGVVTVNKELKKSRDGLKDRAARLFALDRQRGVLEVGETPHWWLVIRDVMQSGDSQLVWEGKLLTNEDAVSILLEHGCVMSHGCADSGWDSTHVYRFCYEHGIGAVKGEEQGLFSHGEVGGKKIFSVETPLHTILNAPPKYSYIRTRDGLKPDPREPLFWRYSKYGIRDRLAYIRSNKSSVKWEVPADVSDDYRAHMESEEQRETRNSRTGEVVSVWVQLKKRNDLFVCECYVAMLMEMGGFIGLNAK